VSGTELSSQTNAVAESGVKLRQPKMYAVTMHNDDVTTMDFVVDVLVRVFRKPPAEASRIMMDIHNNGSGVAGVYTFDLAVTKKIQTERLAHEKGFPLRLTVDELQE